MRTSIIIFFFSFLSVVILKINGQTPNDIYKQIDFKTIDQYFTNPPNQYRLNQFYLDKNFDSNQSQLLKDYGIGGIQTCASYSNYLLSDAGWSQANNNINNAISNNMQVWLSDEKGYPSGSAGGLVVGGYPELEARGVIRIVFKGSGVVSISNTLPSGIDFFRASLCPVINGEPKSTAGTTVPIVNNKIQTIGISGDWQLSVFGIQIINKNTQAQSTPQFGGTGKYPNLLSYNAVKRFIDVTHQSYADKVSNLGQKVELFYTNEPNLMTSYWVNDGTQAQYAYLPWEGELPNKFKSMHGYDLLPYLDALFEGSSNEFKTVRIHYYQTVAEMFSSNFCGQISDWCALNNVKMSGHFLLEEYFACHVVHYGDLFKALRRYDIAACDIPIARKGITNWNFWMPKLISSASYLANKNSMTIALLDPIIGYGNGDLSPIIPDLKRTINMAFLCGINQFTSYMPFTDYTATEHKAFSDYMARISLMFRGAKNEAPIAMYYPIETFQSQYIASSLLYTLNIKNFEYLQKTSDRMATDILQNGLDFNYVSADAILTATINNGSVQIGGNKYSTIVMPRVEVIPLNVLKRLQSISDAGIPIHWVDALPLMGINNSEHTEVENISKTLLTNNYPLSDLQRLRNNTFSVRVSTNGTKLSMNRFIRNNKRMYFIINDSETEITITATSKTSTTIQIYNPVNGEIKTSVLPLSQKIGAFESIFLVEDANDLTSAKFPTQNDLMSSVKVYPNPSDQEINIVVPAKQIGSRLQIANQLGQIVENLMISNEHSKVNIKPYQKGSYIVRINGEISKFIKF
jgi:hypothetical protein